MIYDSSVFVTHELVETRAGVQTVDQLVSFFLLLLFVFFQVIFFFVVKKRRGKPFNFVLKIIKRNAGRN